MLHTPNIYDYIKILINEEVKDFVAVNSIEYFKSAREKLYSKLSEGQNLRKVANSLHIYLTTSDEVEKYAKIMHSNFCDNCVHCCNTEILNLSNPELQLINTNTMVTTKLKELLN